MGSTQGEMKDTRPARNAAAMETEEVIGGNLSAAEAVSATNCRRHYRRAARGAPGGRVAPRRPGVARALRLRRPGAEGPRGGGPAHQLRVRRDGPDLPAAAEPRRGDDALRRRRAGLRGGRAPGAGGGLAAPGREGGG